MVARDIYSFDDVEVSIPSENSEATFVKWTTGKLEISADFEVKVYLPASQPGKFTAKFLGRLSSASTAAKDDSGSSVDVKLGSEAKPYRFKFGSAQQAEVILKLASSNAAKDAAALQGAGEKAWLRDLRRSLAGRRPILFDGVQVLGPEPGDAADEAASDSTRASEVVFGKGVLGLMDPLWHGTDAEKDESKKSLEYELIFYDEEMTVLWQQGICPRMQLEAKELEEGEEAAKKFDLQIVGGNTFKILFDSVEVADDFERDFAVRRRVMDVGFMISRQMLHLESAEQEIARLRLTTRISPWARAAHCALLIPATILLIAWQSSSSATSLCQFLLPYECIVPCNKVIQGM